MCIWVLIWPAGTGPPAPSITASALSAAWDRPYRRATFVMRASARAPARWIWRITCTSSHRAPGYSVSKASASGGRARVATGTRAPPWRCDVGAFSSRLHSGLDPWCPGYPGAAHRLLEPTAASEGLGVFEAGELVDDEHVVLVVRCGHHLGAGATVLLAQVFQAVIDRPPGAVVLDLVPDDQGCGAHGVLPLVPRPGSSSGLLAREQDTSPLGEVKRAANASGSCWRAEE